MDAAISPFRWEHSIGSSVQHFLDFNLHASICHSQAEFHVSLFRKPSFRPHFLHILSQHNSACKSSIFRNETRRALILCSRASAYHACVADIIGYLEDSGYPRFLLRCPEYSACSRSQFLHGGTSKDRPSRKLLYLALPYTDSAKALKINRMFVSSIASASLCYLNMSLRVAWSSKLNSMRRLYGLNWGQNASSMGIG